MCEDFNVLYVVVGKHCPPCEMQHDVIDSMNMPVAVVYVDAGDAGDMIEKYHMDQTPAMVLNGSSLQGFTSCKGIKEFLSDNMETTDDC